MFLAPLQISILYLNKFDKTKIVANNTKFNQRKGGIQMSNSDLIHAIQEALRGSAYEALVRN